MTTALIGTGEIGSVIARLLASGGETLRLSSADNKSARTLAAEIGPAAVVAGDNRDALQGADAVVLALRFTVLKGVIDEIADRLTDKLVVVPSTIYTRPPLKAIFGTGQVSAGLPGRSGLTFALFGSLFACSILPVHLAHLDWAETRFVLWHLWAYYCYLKYSTVVAEESTRSSHCKLWRRT